MDSVCHLQWHCYITTIRNSLHQAHFDRTIQHSFLNAWSILAYVVFIEFSIGWHSLRCTIGLKHQILFRDISNMGLHMIVNSRTIDSMCSSSSLLDYKACFRINRLNLCVRHLRYKPLEYLVPQSRFRTASRALCLSRYASSCACWLRRRAGADLLQSCCP